MQQSRSCCVVPGTVLLKPNIVQFTVRPSPSELTITVLSVSFSKKYFPKTSQAQNALFPDAVALPKSTFCASNLTILLIGITTDWEMSRSKFCSKKSALKACSSSISKSTALCMVSRFKLFLVKLCMDVGANPNANYSIRRCKIAAIAEKVVESIHSYYSPHFH